MRPVPIFSIVSDEAILAVVELNNYQDIYILLFTSIVSWLYLGICGNFTEHTSTKNHHEKLVILSTYFAGGLFTWTFVMPFCYINILVLLVGGAVYIAWKLNNNHG